ncbi:MAG TPA: integrase arm-type DNA-binding domain-containing protein [Gammaproteobacteria bacterium]|nr:integrase arm-type DNA-binding domain-containing protein [Gammaproteobacteria bacterium]
MPKRAKELSAVEVRRLAKRPGFHAVGGVAGLHLNVKDTLAASWILRVKVGDRRPDIGLGAYPDVTLEYARDQAREIKAQIRQGIDPIEARRGARDALRANAAKRLTFDEAAKACHKSKSQEFKNPKHSAQWLSTIETYASPKIGKLPVADVELAHIVKVLEPIWTTKTETASRLRGRIESVLAWATVSGYRTGDNPARWRGNLDHVLPKPSKVRKVKHMRALPWQELPGFMEQLREAEGMAARALEFAILTAARSGEIRLATWDEIDMDAKVWTVPAERMKAGKAHTVPLSAAAMKVLKALPRMAGNDHVFPAERAGSLSDMSISAVCRRMGVAAVPHGFRSTFKDWCRSSTSYADEVSELALAHVSSDATRAAYARDELLPKRTRLMGSWGTFCSTPPKKASVTPIRGRKRG